MRSLSRRTEARFGVTTRQSGPARSPEEADCSVVPAARQLLDEP